MYEGELAVGGADLDDGGGLAEAEDGVVAGAVGSAAIHAAGVRLQHKRVAAASAAEESGEGEMGGGERERGVWRCQPLLPSFLWGRKYLRLLRTLGTFERGRARIFLPVAR